MTRQKNMQNQQPHQREKLTMARWAQKICEKMDEG
jgi:hypothetical protein